MFRVIDLVRLTSSITYNILVHDEDISVSDSITHIIFLFPLFFSVFEK